MRLSTRTRYGTRAMLELALRYESGAVSAKDIAKEQGLSAKYLESLLATLRAAGLVRSVRGAQGGHMLGRAPGEITLREMFDVLEGSEGFVHCTTDAEACERSDACVTQQVWSQLYAACMGILESITLEDLAQRARDRQSSLAIMYHI